MDGGFVATIADVARRRPDAVAVVLEDDQLTYAAVIRAEPATTAQLWVRGNLLDAELVALRIMHDRSML